MGRHAERATALLLIGSVAVAVVGASISWEAPVTVAAVAAAYVLLFVQLARNRSDAAALTAAAWLAGIVGALLVPLSWGTSLFLPAFALPLALPGLLAGGRSRWLAVPALLLNGSLTVVLVLIWFV